MKKLIIFDFDDTITDNSYLDYNSFLFASKKLNLILPKKDDILESRKKGMLAKDITKSYLKKLGKTETFSEYMDLRKQFLQKKSPEYLILKKNFKALLDYLLIQKIEIIICSANNNKKNVIKFLRNNGLKNKFSKILFVGDLGFHLENNTKNNRLLIKSSLLHHVIRMKNLKKNQILFIGNSIEDKIAAKKTQINFINYQNKYLPNIKNKKTVYSINELHNMIKKEMQI